MAEVIWAGAGFDKGFFEGSSCAFGVFDGVHRGHMFLLDCAKDAAQEGFSRSIALTFDIDPDEKFHPDRLQKLMTNEDRLEALAESGVDAVVVLPFTEAFAAYGPEEFLEQTFNGFAPCCLHVGSDFRFGARASGTVEDLKAWGSRTGTQVCAHALENDDGQPITSTRIRLLLKEGMVERANELLGRPYFLKAQVIAGRGQGGGFGFKTANLHIDPMVQTLGDGVYAAWVEVEGLRYRAAVALGASPMFEGQTQATCEAHILDYSGNLYGSCIKVDFMHFLRPMMRFDSQEQLISTVLSNIEWVRTNL
ncbi:MAG: riboflavin biosynthesis protein RibF [Eggerthellaceae bacterium]|nr:riboflavin biosynthesis protein RibF [Eggerthellaceae bacterium]